MPQITEGAKVSLYNIFVVAVNEVRKASHMRRSHLFRTISAIFNENDAMNTFGIPMYDPGQYEEKYKFPRRGSFNCNQKYGYDNGCPFYISFSYILKEKCYVALSGKNARKKCAPHTSISRLVLTCMDVSKSQV